MDELKPCPFCGGKAEEIHASTSGLLSPRIAYYYVQCKTCKAIGPADRVPRKADEAWNRRAVPENKALTEEQIDQMVGEPVWIKFIAESGKDRWETVKPDWDYTGYRATWLAYARKPEGSETP